MPRQGRVPNGEVRVSGAGCVPPVEEEALPVDGIAAGRAPVAVGEERRGLAGGAIVVVRHG